VRKKGGMKFSGSKTARTSAVEVKLLYSLWIWFSGSCFLHIR
jgi:hypothetical protein